MQIQTFFGKGKLLLTGEYFVLDGAKVLAVPTQLGQKLTILPQKDGLIHKKSVDNLDKCWYLGNFDLKTFQNLDTATKNEAIATRLQQIFTAIRELNPDFLQNSKGVTIKTELDFPRAWGLGTSSTLIYTLAKWADIDPFVLLAKTFGGSGYDIACAGAESPIFYQIKNKQPTWEATTFNPPFLDNLYFVYLGKKQNSREGIAAYKEAENSQQWIPKIDQITSQMPLAKTLSEFENLINEHEAIVSNLLKLTRAQDLYFKNYWGAVKSLGAWGGDFVLVTSDRFPEETKAFFNERGFDVVLKYKDLIYNAGH